MTQGPFYPDDQPIRCVIRSAPTRKRRGMKAGGAMLTRVLPGSALVAAALIVPEFSVGADHAGHGPAAADPPEPAAKPDPARAPRLVASAAPTHPKFAGVRYAPMIDLGTDTAHAAGRARPQAARPASARERNVADAVPTPAAFEQAFADPAFAAPSVSVPAAPLAAPAGSAPGIAAQPAAAPLPASEPLRAAAVPQIAPALTAAPSAATPAELPAAPALAEAPSSPLAGEADALAFAGLLPEEQSALRAPAGAGALSAAPVASQPAPTPAAVTVAVPAPARPAALAPAGVSAQPAARGMIDQVTPARIAAARLVAAPAPASAPATALARIAPAPAPTTAALAGARAPAAAAPVAAAAKPAPAAAVAVAPKQAAALTATPAAAGAPRIADLDFKSRLLTRVDGRTRGQVDFQQTPAGLKVRLGSVVEVLADRLPAAELARIRSSSSGNAWLSLAELQAQGIPISYDPVYDEFNIGREDTRPKAARKVHIDQISAPERDDGAATMDQIRRR